MTDQVKNGKKLILMIITYLILFKVAANILSIRYNHFQVSDIVIDVILIWIMYMLYQGYRWARWFIIIWYGLGMILFMFIDYQDIHLKLIIILIIIMGTSLVTLAISKDIDAFLTFKREISKNA